MSRHCGSVADVSVPSRAGARLRTFLAALVVTLLAGAQPALAVPYELGDVFVAVGHGKIKQFSPNGTLKDTLDTRSGAPEDPGMCFDAASNLYSTNFLDQSMTKFDDAGNVLTYPFGSGFNADPESCVLNGSGSMYVGQADGTGDILKFSLSGDPQGSFNPARENRGTDWIDLAADDCTMYYTSEGRSVKRFNVCTNTQLPDFATGLPGSNAYALRLLPGGGALVADTGYIVHLDPSGNVVKAIPASRFGGTSLLFALNLDPDGKTFWTADFRDGKITRVDINTGEQVSQFNSHPEVDVGGLTIFGQLCRNCPATLDLDPNSATNPVGTTHTVTATLVNPSGSKVDQPLAFEVTGANSSSGFERTDSSGRASFAYTGTKVGDDTINVCFDKNENHACDPEELVTATAKKTWTAPPNGPPWQGWVTSHASGCSARVQVPYLDANEQVTAYTEVFCPRDTQLTLRSRLRSDYGFQDLTVAQQGCIGRPECVVTEPKGYRYSLLSCPKSPNRLNRQRYFTSLIFYPGTRRGAATTIRSRHKFLSPFCAD
jgi:sugar lactone lactonase YvrE